MVRPKQVLSQTTPRKMPRFVRDAFKDAHSKRIGNVVWAWNQLHERFLALFSELVDSDEHYVGIGIWHALYNDKAQREALIAVAKVRLARHPHILKYVLLSTKAAAELSGIRNMFVHVPVANITYEGEKISASRRAISSHARKFNAVDVTKLARFLYRDLDSLSKFVETMFVHLSACGMEESWDFIPLMWQKRQPLRSLALVQQPTHRNIQTLLRKDPRANFQS